MYRVSMGHQVNFFVLSADLPQSADLTRLALTAGLV